MEHNIGVLVFAASIVVIVFGHLLKTTMEMSASSLGHFFGVGSAKPAMVVLSSDETAAALTPFKQSAVGHHVVDVSPAQIFSLQLREIRGATVRFFFYQKEKVVKRSLWLPSANLARKLRQGDESLNILPAQDIFNRRAIKDAALSRRRIALADLAISGSWENSVQEIFRKTEADASSCLAGLQDDKKDVKAKPKQAKSAAAEQHELSSAAVTTVTEIASVAPHDAATATEKKSPVPMGDVHLGVLSWCGFARFNDPKCEGKTFPCYAVDIKYDDGSKNRLKGTDLQRAIEEAHVDRGDRIKLFKVRKVGNDHSRQDKDGETIRAKILWHVEKLS